MDDKDLEIARLKGLVEGQQAARGGGVAVGTLKVLGVLAAVAIGGVLILAVVGSMLPDEPTLTERQAECRRIHGEAPSREGNACMARNLVAEIERQSR